MTAPGRSGVRKVSGWVRTGGLGGCLCPVSSGFAAPGGFFHLSQVSLAGEDGCVPSSQKAHSKPVLGGACGPVREVPRAGLCTQTELVFPAEVWSFGGKAPVLLPLQRRRSMSTVAAKRRKTAMERKASPGGSGRWGLCVLSKGTTVVLGFGASQVTAPKR